MFKVCHWTKSWAKYKTVKSLIRIFLSSFYEHILDLNWVFTWTRSQHFYSYYDNGRFVFILILSAHNTICCWWRGWHSSDVTTAFYEVNNLCIGPDYIVGYQSWHVWNILFFGSLFVEYEVGNMHMTLWQGDLCRWGEKRNTKQKFKEGKNTQQTEIFKEFLLLSSYPSGLSGILYPLCNIGCLLELYWIY